MGFCPSCSEKHEDKTEITPLDELVIGAAIDAELQKSWETDSTAGVLRPENYPQAYQYISRIEQEIVQSPYINEKVHAIKIVEDNSNKKTAFVTPGGYIYIYKKLLQTLDSESQLVGVLSCLMACHESGRVTQKMTDRFSVNYMLDLAIGGKLDNITEVYNELCLIPYDSLWVSSYDEKSIGTLCHAGYDIQDYSDLFSLHANIEWMNLFPRPTNYATVLFNRKDPTTCNGEIANRSPYQDMVATLPQ